jgi:hypothetical protein
MSFSDISNQQECNKKVTNILLKLSTECSDDKKKLTASLSNLFENQIQLG